MDLVKELLNWMGTPTMITRLIRQAGGRKLLYCTPLVKTADARMRIEIGFPDKRMILSYDGDHITNKMWAESIEL
jgi:hypothetical protein